MLPPIVRSLRSFGLTLALLLAAEGLAASRRSPLLGQTRDQILDRLGDPRSAIVTGNREVLLFARERVTLRDGVVIDVQTLPSETAPRLPSAAPAVPPAPAPAPSSLPAAAPASSVAAPLSDPSASTVPAGPVAPIVPIQGYSMPVAATPPAVPPGVPPAAPTPAASAVPAAVPTVESPAAAPPEPRLEIRAVRPPGSVVAAGAVDPIALAPAVEEAPPGGSSLAQARAPSAGPAPVRPVAPSPSALPARGPVASTPSPAPGAVSAPEPAREVSLPALVGIAGAVIGLGFLAFRWSGRRRTPSLTSAALSHQAARIGSGATAVGVQFTTALIRGLGFRRFRDLVAAYYGKTGAVATPVEAGPDDVVHVKIFWKGETKPFACVRCVAPAPEPVPAVPLEQLGAVLVAEDVRRGYVVTSGEFGPDARDLAEEKSMTLLSGDLFVEKLNALPEAARSELMDLVLASDAG